MQRSLSLARRAIVASTSPLKQTFNLAAVRCSSAGAPGWSWHEDLTNIVKAIALWGPSLTMRKFLHMKDIRFGNKVGEDSMGNSYYENTNYQYGRHRWVEYAGLPWSSEVEQTTVDADWYGWLHYTTDQKGNDYRLQEGEKINQGSDVPYNHGVGGVIEPFSRNNTSVKRRAYNDGVSPAVDSYWKQPSHPSFKDKNKRTGPVFHEARVEEWTPPNEEPKKIDPKNQPAGFTDGKFTRDLNDY